MSEKMHSYEDAMSYGFVRIFSGPENSLQQLAAVWSELQSASDAFPPFASAHEGYAVILEELDELWDEIKNNKEAGAINRQRYEATQLAAMAIRFLIDIKKEETDG